MDKTFYVTGQGVVHPKFDNIDIAISASEAFELIARLAKTLDKDRLGKDKGRYLISFHGLLQDGLFPASALEAGVVLTLER